jgi:hypothetical protein
MVDDSGGGGTSPLVVALVAVFSALIGAGATLGVAYFTFASKDQELKVHLVEIAVSILRADPKEDVTPARGWALEIIEKNSGVPFSGEDRQALLHKPLSSLSSFSALKSAFGAEGPNEVAGMANLLEALKGISPAPKMPNKQIPAEGK